MIAYGILSLILSRGSKSTTPWITLEPSVNGNTSIACFTLQSGYSAAFFHLIFDGAAAGVSIALVLLQECLGGTMRFPLDIQLCFQSFQVSIRFF